LVAFNPDGSSLLTIALAPDGQTRVMRLWGAASHQPKTAPTLLPGRGDYRIEAGFSPDGRFIVTSGGPQGFRLWSTSNLEPVTPYMDDGKNGAPIDQRPKLDLAPRSLLTSHDNKGGLILVGIGNRSGLPRVVPWSLPSDARAGAEVVRDLEVMASRRIDTTTALVSLTPNEMRDRWAALAGSSARVEPSHEAMLAWHRRQAEECELIREWFCTAWDISRFAELEPSGMDASLHIDK